MKPFKKAKDLLNKMTGRDGGGPRNPPPAATGEPVAPPEPVVQDPRYAYRRVQRDLARRAKLTTLFWDSAFGPHNRGQNHSNRCAKRQHRALHGVPGGWKKRERLNGIAVFA